MATTVAGGTDASVGCGCVAGGDEHPITTTSVPAIPDTRVHANRLMSLLQSFVVVVVPTLHLRPVPGFRRESRSDHIPTMCIPAAFRKTRLGILHAVIRRYSFGTATHCDGEQLGGERHLPDRVPQSAVLKRARPPAGWRISLRIGFTKRSRDGQHGL